jgi:CBS domain containing-hemolysin-like protein
MFVLYSILFISFVLLSAFFSSAETSILSLNKIKLDIRAKKGSVKEKQIKSLLENPQNFFSTILLGNNLVNVAAATVSTAFFAELFIGRKELILLFSTIFTTGILLVFSELIPKTLALHYNERLSRLYVSPLKFIYYLFFPFVFILSFFSRRLTRPADNSKTGRNLNHEEIKYFLSSETSTFKYSAEVQQMLSQIIDITQKDIKNSMIPRINIVGIEESIKQEQLIKLLKENKFAKYPVYQKSLDRISGFVDRDDLLWQLVEGNEKDFALQSILKEPFFLSEYSSLNYILKHFRRHRNKIGIIVDEYGVTVGLITIKDIVNDIVSDLQLESNSYAKITDNIHIVSGDEPIFRVNEKLHLSLPDSSEYTTLSGLFLYYFGKLPQPGNQIEIGRILLSVKKMDEHRISSIIVEKF